MSNERVGILIFRARNPQSLGLGKVQEMEVVTEISSRVLGTQTFRSHIHIQILHLSHPVQYICLVGDVCECSIECLFLIEFLISKLLYSLDSSGDLSSCCKNWMSQAPIRIACLR